MAGFFGLFDYTKPGKGIEKGGPTKHRFFVFFEIFFRRFWSLIGVNLLYALFWMPLPIIGMIVTTITNNGLYLLIGVGLSLLLSGPINMGLTFILRNYAREEQAYVWSDFIGAAKANWKQGLITSVINTAVYALLCYAAFFYNTMREGFDAFFIFLLVIILAMFLFTFMQYYINLMVVSCKLTLRQIYKNALSLALLGLPRNLLVSLLVVPCVLILVSLTITSYVACLTIVFPILLLVGFSFGGFYTVFCVYPFFQKMVVEPYYKEHPEEITDSMRTWNYMKKVVDQADAAANDPSPEEVEEVFPESN